jgi:hypothetical protein
MFISCRRSRPCEFSPSPCLRPRAYRGPLDFAVSPCCRLTEHGSGARTVRIHPHALELSRKTVPAFARFRATGAWFDPDESILAFIRAVARQAEPRADEPVARPVKPLD